MVNATDEANAIAYTMVPAPTAASEYRIDLVAATVVFGAPQREGDTLDVTYWTMEWHDPTESDLMRGTVALELWTGDSASIATLSRGVQDRLGLRVAPRELGFTRLEPVMPDLEGEFDLAEFSMSTYLMAIDRKLPITGVPLPLISYSGSFVLMIMFGLGIVNSVWVHRKVPVR